jgi:hypothetical protein
VCEFAGYSFFLGRTPPFVFFRKKMKAQPAGDTKYIKFLSNQIGRILQKQMLSLEKDLVA